MSSGFRGLGFRLGGLDLGFAPRIMSHFAIQCKPKGLFTVGCTAGSRVLLGLYGLKRPLMKGCCRVSVEFMAFRVHVLEQHIRLIPI